MELPNLRSATSSFGSSDLIRSKAEQTFGKLDASSEFKLDLGADEGKATSLTDSPSKPEGEDLRKAFQDFVGQTLFSQMISSMRSTQDGAAYFNGGRAEKILSLRKTLEPASQKCRE